MRTPFAVVPSTPNRGRQRAGVEYEIVDEVPVLRWGRKAVIAGIGDSKVPRIECDEGTRYRKESGEMAQEIREGLFDAHDRPATETPRESLPQ